MANPNPNPTLPTSPGNAPTSNPATPTPLTNTSSSTTITPEELRKRIQKKLIIWSTFSVLVGLLTILASLLASISNGKSMNFFDLISHGELLLISMAIAADALGDMIYNKRFDSVTDTSLSCLCFTAILICVIWFGLLGGKATNTTMFGIVSLFIFVGTISVGATCKAHVEAPSGTN